MTKDLMIIAEVLCLQSEFRWIDTLYDDPDNLADPCISCLVLEPGSVALDEEEEPVEARESGEAKRLDGRFLEPACGSGNFLVRLIHKAGDKHKKKTRAVARALMWCNRMLVNGSTADFERSHKTPNEV